MRSIHARRHSAPEPEEELPADLVELKRRADAAGVSIQLPKAGATLEDREQMRLKDITLSEVVVRLRRGGEL
ncbi:MAG TPA: hypothetical protein VFQ39_07505 [Longimicrobium sp.]|nr:hypothetical protein [Longimicrobium sp.]